MFRHRVLFAFMDEIKFLERLTEFAKALLPAREAVSKPYTLADMPEQIKDLPSGAQKVWVAVFNLTLEQTEDEGQSREAAWGAVKELWQQDEDGTWRRIAKEALREELREARAKRAKRYGVAAKEGGHLTPPKGYPADAESYGDPTNYVYPLNPGRRQAARSYFNHEGQREAGGYTSAEWAIVGKRIASASGEAYEYKDGKVQRKEAKRVEKSFYIPIAKADAAKHLVYGVVLEPDAADGQGDTISAEEIERACHSFMLRSQTLDLEHERELDKVEAAIVENYIASQELTWERNGQTTMVQPGSWVMVTKVFSDDIWKQVEEGALTGYSIRGWGVRKQVGQ